MATAAPTAAREKLGKLPVATDVRTLSFARYVDRATLPKAPPSLDLSRTVLAWPMYANDRIGDCTVAAAAHMIEAWSGAVDGTPEEVAERYVLAAFDRVKVVDPASGEAGAYELDVLKDWRSHGIGGHKIGAFAKVSVSDTTLLRTAAYLFGGLFIGIQLPLTAQGEGTWEWSGELTGPPGPARGAATPSTSSPTTTGRSPLSPGDACRR